AAPEPVAAVVRPEVSLLERLKMFNLAAAHDAAAAQDLQARRPNGHSTHNLLVKDKKTKKLLLVSHRQQAQVNCFLMQIDLFVSCILFFSRFALPLPDDCC